MRGVSRGRAEDEIEMASPTQQAWNWRLGDSDEQEGLALSVFNGVTRVGRLKATDIHTQLRHLSLDLDP